MEKEDVSVKVPKASDKIETSTIPRKLKKISVQDIADKINKTRKRTVKDNAGPTKPQIKQPLPQFGKTGGKKKVKKKDNRSLVKYSIEMENYTLH